MTGMFDASHHCDMAVCPVNNLKITVIFQSVLKKMIGKLTLRKAAQFLPTLDLTVRLLVYSGM